MSNRRATVVGLRGEAGIAPDRGHQVERVRPLGRMVAEREPGGVVMHMKLAEPAGYVAELHATSFPTLGDSEWSTDNLGPAVLLPELQFGGGITHGVVKAPYGTTCLIEWRGVYAWAEATPLATHDGLRRAVRLILAEWPGSGRPSEVDDRIAAIVSAAAEMGDGATRARVAQRLGRVDSYGVERSDYKRDVRRAGGWRAVLRLARYIGSSL